MGNNSGLEAPIYYNESGIYSKTTKFICAALFIWSHLSRVQTCLLVCFKSKHKAFFAFRSPSSQSALAESELEYNPKHKSLSAFFRFRVSLFNCKSKNLQLLRLSMQKLQILVSHLNYWAIVNRQNFML